ncbi:hypothetical protein MB46_19985 (plasmid) [Arthrobacter alpinus]|uniref:thioesterase II family protein n=1 Tax=Arthrobacter alpinus TaxID=656366 RepID=UPI0005C80C3C|nr:alpha/beta fold hydrolase [Arthrobacter alpinus]ALV47807.1 hypothetical protein MB46_19185 [Arthrobacter alpinus]ALV47947.1 hypothetical protein MB46_19985 [Arthrobacter alpinus]
MASGTQLFCLHHAGGTTASFAGWRFSGVDVTKLSYRGRDFNSMAETADYLASQIEASPSQKIALYGHSMGAILAFEVALRLQDSGRIEHVFLAAARAPIATTDDDDEAFSVLESAGALTDRARQILLEDLSLLATYPGRPQTEQLKDQVTVLYGRDDPVVPAFNSALWVSWCSITPRLVEISGGGHLFHRANSEAFEVVQSVLSPDTHLHPVSSGTVRF